MEDSRQDLRTKFRAAAESSGLAGFGLASVGMLCARGPESSKRAVRLARVGRYFSGGSGMLKSWERTVASTSGSSPRRAPRARSERAVAQRQRRTRAMEKNR